MPFLKHSINGSVAHIIELADRVDIGRAPECAIVVDDPTVSQHHALLERNGDTWLLTDTDSTNGLRVAGELVSGCELHDGLVFSIGAQSFEFCMLLPESLDQTLKIKKSWIPGVYYTK